MAKYSYHQLDANHAEIRAGLLAVGATVEPKGPLDMLVGFKGANYLIEVKTAKGKLRPSQERFLSRWKGQAIVVRTLDEALIAIGGMPPCPKCFHDRDGVGAMCSKDWCRCVCTDKSR